MEIIIAYIILLPEIFATALTFLSPLIPNKLFSVFIIIALFKTFTVMKYDLDKDKIILLIISGTSLLYDIGLLLRFSNGYVNSISELKTILITAILSISAGMIIYKLIKKLVLHDSYTLFIIVYMLLNSLLALLYAVFHTDLGDGSVNIAGINLQIPELLKLELCVLPFLIGKITAFHRKTLWYLIFTVFPLTIMLISKERGTTLLFFYHILIMWCMISYSEYSRHGDSSKKLAERLSAAYIIPPMIYFFFLATVNALDIILMKRFPLRGSDGEHAYGNDFLFSLSLRIHSDSSQIIEARRIMKEALPIQFNFNSSVTIPSCTGKTALCDYSYVILCQSLGKWPAAFIILLFVVSLIIPWCDTDNLLVRAVSAMLIIQVYIQISGIVFSFLFTGISIPMLSVGGSCCLSSFILITLIIINIKEEP